MATLASVPDVEQRLGRVFTDAEIGRVTALLDDASELVRLEAGRTWVDDDGNPLPIPGAVRMVVLRMVDRAIRNPDGFSAESDGDYSYQRTQVEPGIYLTDAERAILRRATGRTGLWTQPTTRGEPGCNTVWMEDSFGFELFPVDVRYDDC